MPIPEGLQLDDAARQAWPALGSRAVLAGVYNERSVIVKCGDNRLQREAAVLQAVDFEGVPTVVNYTEENNQTVLVMERLPGTPLSDYINLDGNWQSRELPITEVIRIVDGLALCFEALHQAGYLYRDLNLNHVIVDKTKIGLVDHEWCVPANAAGWGRVDSRAGTWETMAPEEFRVGNRITQMSNTYTLGVVLLQLTAGHNPFFISAGELPTAELQRIRSHDLHEQLPATPADHPAISQIARKALRPAPSKRYQSVATFREALSTLGK